MIVQDKNILGKGEVESSILSRSTIQDHENKSFSGLNAPHSPASASRTKQHLHDKSGGNPGDTFSGCSEESEIIRAGEWLSIHHDECGEPITCWVQRHFGFTKMQAVRALQIAHGIRYARAG